MNDDINKDLGIVTAYAYAVSKGYTGTEDDFAALMADYAAVGLRAEAAATAAAASATVASGSASDSAASATAAAGSAGTATTAAGNASQSATTATTKASESAQSATQAAGSATTASTKASEAAQSALQAAGSATAAESAKTAAQAAQTAAETAQTAAETAQTAAEDAAESVSASAAQIAQNTADISSVKNALGACIITDTASGAIATFTDGSDGVPMESVTVDMEPIQDLHGQDAPYPGGGGKNLLPLTVDGIKSMNTGASWSGNSYTTRGVTFTINTDSVGNVIGITANGTADSSNASLSIPIPTTIESGTSVTLNGCPSHTPTSGGWDYRIWVGASGYGDIANDVGNGTTFNYVNVTMVWLQVGNKKTASNIVFKPMIRLSSVSDATFAPYSNICPISGRSEVGVTRTGVNVYPVLIGADSFDNNAGGTHSNDNGTLVINATTQTSSGVYSFGSSTLRQIQIKLLTGHTITYSYDIRTSVNATILIGIEGFGKKNVSSTPTWQRVTHTATITGTGGAFVVYSSNVACTIEVKNFQYEFGSTATDYAPYTADTITVQLGQTVYGGTVDAVSGVMTVDRVYLNMADIPSWSIDHNAQRFYKIMTNLAPAASAALAVDGLICNRFASISANAIYANTQGVAMSQDSALQFHIDGLTDVPNFTNAMVLEYFANNPTYVVAKLAQPVTVQLDPQTLTSLLGVNNVWSDGGNVSVEYVADTKSYIAKVIAAALA